LFGLALVTGQSIENLTGAGVVYASVAVGADLVLVAASTLRPITWVMS